jgi:hypothetical protein
MLGEFVFADITVGMMNAPLLAVFLPIEALFTFVWIRILIYNHKSVLAVFVRDGVARIETLCGKSYRVPVSEIRVKKAFIHYRLKFDGVELNANNSNKSVGDFIAKCRNVPHRKR